MEAEDDEREQAEQAFEHRRQEAFGDRRDGADELVLRDLVYDVDQVHALGAVAVALMDGVDAQEAGHAVRPRRPADAHRHRRRLRPRDHRAPRAVGPRTPQVVDVARRDPGEAFEARVAKPDICSNASSTSANKRMSAPLYLRANGRPRLPPRRSQIAPVSRHCRTRRSICWRERPVATTRNFNTTPLSRLPSVT